MGIKFGTFISQKSLIELSKIHTEYRIIGL